MTRNDYMKNYWRGYRAAKATVYECGRAAAINEYDYGLQGMHPAYCDGWRRYLYGPRR